MRKLAVLGMALLFSAVMSGAAYAGTEINSLTVSFVEDQAEPGTVNQADVQVDNDNVSVDVSQPSRSYGDWRPGSKITWKVVLVPEDGYNFVPVKLKTVNVQNGETVSSTIGARRITMKINYMPKVTLESPQNIYFSDNNTAKWDKVQYCDRYEVEIFKEDDDGNYSSYKTVQVSTPQIDLSQYVTDGSDSYFRVRAIAKNSSQSVYLKSSDWTNSNDMTSSDDNTVSGNFSGSGPSMTFLDLSGNPVSGWQKINGNWYYFDPANSSQAVTTAWAMVNNKWYYFNDYGIMVTGWVKVKDVWYYLGVDGAMKTGWYQEGPNGSWYYLDPGSGAMQTGWHLVDGRWYYLDSGNGALWVSATTPDGYRVDASGAWYS